MKSPLKCALAVVLLYTATACGSLETAEPGSDATAPTSPSPSEESTPNPSAASQSPATEAQDDSQPPAGTWQGPRNKDGSKPTLFILSTGDITLESSGITCTGNIETIEGGDYIMRFTECATPLPAITLSAAADGNTMTATAPDGETEKWYFKGPTH